MTETLEPGNIKAFPYRKKNGHCSILEAVDFEDAKQYLAGCHGKGTVFCEIEINHCDMKELFDENIDQHVAGFLHDNVTYKI